MEAVFPVRYRKTEESKPQEIGNFLRLLFPRLTPAAVLLHFYLTVLKRYRYFLSEAVTIICC
ncbi:hypothetical protein DWY69_14355 [Eisenbergiella massiliensis]|uniref:Uncharacterized protein n=1 Tax=Eisenbergiella massiliensis TaxID=1720294 RepID=A0A3E3IVD6_9FIRM|nr:hypothetical protein DWY69_14355 [Eisenbergiella massiliensis]